MRSVSFSLPFALESLNVRDRKHIMQRTGDKGQMRLEILAAIGGPRYLPRPPFARARITIVRYSKGRLDLDGLPATAKNLLDCLCIQSKMHPTGVGIIIDDSPRHLELVIEQDGLAPLFAPYTTVVIDELPELPAEPPKKRRVRRGPRPPTQAQIAAAVRGALFTGRGQ